MVDPPGEEVCLLLLCQMSKERDKAMRWRSMNSRRACSSTTPLNLISLALVEPYVANKMPSERNCMCLIPAKPLENKPCGHPIALMNALYWADLNGVVLGKGMHPLKSPWASGPRYHRG